MTIITRMVVMIMRKECDIHSHCVPFQRVGPICCLEIYLHLISTEKYTAAVILMFLAQITSAEILEGTQEYFEGIQ